MNLSADFFELFGLVRRFTLDRAQLDKAYRDLQAAVHPDRFAHASAAEQRVSMQWATRVNEGYTTLRHPLSRAQYLLELMGEDIGAESNTAMPTDFLIEQMTWREDVEEAQKSGDYAELEILHQRLLDELDTRYGELAGLLDDASRVTHSESPDGAPLPLKEDSEHLQKNIGNATSEVRKLMFLEKLAKDIDETMADLEEKM